MRRFLVFHSVPVLDGARKESVILDGRFFVLRTSGVWRIFGLNAGESMVNESVVRKEAWNESVREVWDQGLRSTWLET